jgi:8-oxo-dGTP pyrophosphatase MutT (NUDIX family)
MTRPVSRVGGRMVLVDSEHRVLLIHERIEHGKTHWLTPGGGVEPGEQPHHAAVREAFEETGIAIELPAHADAALVARRLWSWAGISYDQVDHFFTARVAAGLPVEPRALTDVERQTLLGHRWWTVEELRASTETVEPPDLADLVEALVRPAPMDA